MDFANIGTYFYKCKRFCKENAKTTKLSAAFGMGRKRRS